MHGWMKALPPALVIGACAAQLLGCSRPEDPYQRHVFDSVLDVFTSIDGPTSGTLGQELKYTAEISVAPGRFASSALQVVTGAGGHEVRPQYDVGQLFSGTWLSTLSLPFTLRPTERGTYEIIYRRQLANGIEPAVLTIEVK